VQVGFSDEWTYWSASGEHLLIENAFDEPGTLTHVEVIGGAFARQPIGARDTTSQRPRWNASGRDDWIVFESDDSHAPRWHPHLWYRETRQTFSVDIGMGNYGLSKWSPGGRYLAIRSYDESAVDSEQVLYVQDELGNQWRVDDVTMPLDGGSWDFVWQP
jgi:Tol biopolymer transport system component